MNPRLTADEPEPDGDEPMSRAVHAFRELLDTRRSARISGKDFSA